MRSSARAASCPRRTRFSRIGLPGNGENQRPRDVRRLKIGRCRGSANARRRRRARCRRELDRRGRPRDACAACDAGHRAASGRFDVAFGAGDLSREVQARPRTQLQLRVEQTRRVDERVAVHHAQPQPLRVREPGQLAERLFLRRPRQPRLKADQVEALPSTFFVAQLHDRVGRFAGARIAQADRFERTEAQRVLAARRPSPRSADSLRSKRVSLRNLWLVARSSVRRSAMQLRVLRSIERNVEIVVAVALFVARLAVDGDSSIESAATIGEAAS